MFADPSAHANKLPVQKERTGSREVLLAGLPPSRPLAPHDRLWTAVAAGSVREFSPAGFRFGCDVADECNLESLVSRLYSLGLGECARRVEHDWAKLRLSVAYASARASEKDSVSVGDRVNSAELFDLPASEKIP